MLVKNYKREEMDQMKVLPNIKIPFFNEGQLYLTDRDTVVKRISNLNGNYFSNKLYTIHSLENKRNVINMEELVLPTNLVSINKEVVGYEMPYIHGVTLDDYLKYERITTRSCGTEFIPSVETDLYCYSIMILNKVLLDNLSRVYSDRPNVNVDCLLESTEEIHGKSRYRSK